MADKMGIAWDGVKRKTLYDGLQGLVRGQGELCYFTRSANGKLRPTGCKKVSIVYDTGAPKSVLHPKVAPEPFFPRGPLEKVRGAGRAMYPTTIAYLRTSGCKWASISPWVSADAADAFGVDVIVGDDYMEAANVIVAPQSGTAECP